MVNVSDKAAAALHETLQQNESDTTEVLRFTETEEGYALTLGEQRDGDELVRHADRVVLAIEPELSEAFDGATIDAVDTPEGTRLIFQAPPGAPAGD